jgi:hypothetical protein
VKRGDPVGQAHQSHWDGVHERDATQLSWYQSHAAVSVELIGALGVPLDAAVIDVGGGASRLVDGLVAGGFTDVSVLDVSVPALDVARRRLGPAARNVRWLHEDLLSWEPTRQYGLWHDRAFFHFLVDPSDQCYYRDLLSRALAPGAGLVIATFAAHGPTYCSGLPVARYELQDLLTMLGGDLQLVATRREEHTTPNGAIQPFTWLAARKPR